VWVDSSGMQKQMTSTLLGSRRMLQLSEAIADPISLEISVTGSLITDRHGRAGSEDVKLHTSTAGILACCVYHTSCWCCTVLFTAECLPMHW
jgi:hypothetical protein